MGTVVNLCVLKYNIKKDTIINNNNKKKNNKRYKVGAVGAVVNLCVCVCINYMHVCVCVFIAYKHVCMYVCMYTYMFRPN